MVDCIYHMAALSPPPPGPTFVLRGTQSPVNTLHFGPPSQALGSPLLFSGSQSGLVHIWSLQTRRTVATLNGHGGQGVTWLKTLPQGHQLLSQGRDLRLCLWDLAEGRNTILDAVQLDSVGFCKSSILARGQLCWMLAVPGKGNSEQRGPRSATYLLHCSSSSLRLMPSLVACELLAFQGSGLSKFPYLYNGRGYKTQQQMRQDCEPLLVLAIKSPITMRSLIQILEMPSKTSVCTLKPEADAKPGMPMCLGLWQVRQRAPATPDSPESCPTRLHLSSNLWALSFRERVPAVFWGPTLTGHRLLLGSCWCLEETPTETLQGNHPPQALTGLLHSAQMWL
ncbi:hypothetical protein U0070_023803 [Myodes glareolus]|uniref:Guanine nucleotide-binding protein subunit beta-like protein 1 n=1 Tax=Myodes glareolus TaxID=447135 RepID=A0AAW0HTA9_MYOGA